MAVRVEKSYTIAEFDELLARPENADRLLELIDGVIIEKTPTTLRGYIIAILAGGIGNFIDLYSTLGWAMVGSCYRMPHDDENTLIPDVSFVQKTEERTLARLLAENPVPYMPDLAIEVQSPDQSDKFMTDKAAYYLANGSKMVWLVYASKRIVEVLTPTERFLLTEAHTLNGGTVLPEFSLPVADIFPKLQ